MDVAAQLFGYSKGLYSTWVRYKPDNLLVDCGEGCATTLGNGGYAIERVLLTHGHLDHISGLPALLWSRTAGMGDNLKPLEVFYPRNDLYVADMISYLKSIQNKLSFNLTWTPLDAGQSFALNNEDGTHARRVETWATEHMPGRLTLGYKIIETRRRLKNEYSNLSQDELRAEAANGTELSETYDATLAAFGGDGLPLRPDDVQGAELLLHEATILDAADRKHQLHATIGEAMQVAAEVSPKALVLQHFSGRYRTAEIKDAIQQEVARLQITFPVWCLFRDRLWNEFNPS
jgi:ribonuclease Z